MSSSLSLSLSLESSVHVDGSYSCFSGEDERRFVFQPGRLGVRTGVLDPFKVDDVAGLGERCGGVGGGRSASSLAPLSPLDLRAFLVFGDVEADIWWSNSFVSVVGVVGWLVLRDLGMDGRSVEGTEDTLLCMEGLCGDAGGETSV